MDHLSLHCLMGLSIILLTRHPTFATPIFNDSFEGSGQWDSGSADLTPTPSSSPFLNESVKSTSIDGENHSKPFLDQLMDLLLSPTPSYSSFLNESVKSTAIDGEKHSKSFLDQLVVFLRENHLPIIVISTLLFLIITILCSAAILSRRRKVSTYYPCDFPSKMYVDEQDKTGGARIFNEVPEKTNTSSSEEPVNSAKKLQEDIMLATKNLRTPIKTPWKEKNEVAEDQKHAEDEECVQCDKSQEESCGSLEDKTTNQSAVEDSVEKSCPSRSQDSVPAFDMEKTDPLDSGPPEESKHPSEPENSESHEDTNKQDVATSGSPFISEEKTAF